MYYQKILILTYSEFQTNVKLNLQYFSVIQTTSQFKSLMNSKIFLNFRAFNFGGDEVIFSLANVKIPQLYKQSSQPSCTNNQANHTTQIHPCQPLAAVYVTSQSHHTDPYLIGKPYHTDPSRLTIPHRSIPASQQLLFECLLSPYV